MGRKAGRDKYPPDHPTKRKQALKGLYTALERALHPFPRWWQKRDWATGTGRVNQIKTAGRQAQKAPRLRNSGPLPLWELRTVHHSELCLAAQHSSPGLPLHASKQHDHNCRHWRKKSPATWAQTRPSQAPPRGWEDTEHPLVTLPEQCVLHTITAITSSVTYRMIKTQTCCNF